jgi:hypothetical protein
MEPLSGKEMLLKEPTELKGIDDALAAGAEITVLDDPDADAEIDAICASAGCKPRLPKIIITTEEHKVNAQAIEALAADTTMYQRGGMLVRILRDTTPAAKGIRRPNAPRIAPLPRAILQERMAANARWVRKTKDGEEVPAHPEGWSVSAVFDYGAWPSIPHLEAVVDHPVVRPDGTILSQPGYDPATGLLLAPHGKMPDVKDSPTHQDAEDAWKVLSDVVADFPFATDAHRAAWLAALLTPLARFAFAGPSPLFLVDANVRGSGKGLLVSTISRILTGKNMTTATYTNSEEELRKRITSIAVAGDQLVMFDNLVGTFGGPVLDAALTATSWKDRILGGNRLCDVPLYVSWYATGNNVMLGADTTRRVCHIRLESPLEKPELRRDFAHKNLLRYVRKHRRELLGAALTILRGYAAAGKPDLDLPAMGSFEEWSDLVRSAVVWCGLPDPAETRMMLQDRADTTVEGMVLILRGWQQMDPDGKGMTAARVVEQLYPRDRALAKFTGPGEDEVRAGFELLCPKHDARALGNVLRLHQRRIFDGVYIDHLDEDKEHKIVRWGVFRAEAFPSKVATGSTGTTGSKPIRPGTETPSATGSTGTTGSKLARAGTKVEDEPAQPDGQRAKSDPVVPVDPVGSQPVKPSKQPKDKKAPAATERPRRIC